MKEANKGSPPLARGTVIFSPRHSNGAGITPACAGNSITLSWSYPPSRDHPRLRGEQARAVALATQSLGSPPLARGTAKSSIARWYDAGITPACAGNRALQETDAGLEEDHPRLRGEQCFVPHLPACTQGSPPLARGTGTFFSRFYA